MSNYICPYCDAENIDGPDGYSQGCDCLKNVKLTGKDLSDIQKVLNKVVERWGNEYPGSSIGIAADIAKDLLVKLEPNLKP